MAPSSSSALKKLSDVRQNLEEQEASRHVALKKKAQAARRSLDLETRKAALQEVQDELKSLRRSSTELAGLIKDAKKEEELIEKRRLSSRSQTSSKSSQSYLKPYSGPRAGVLEKTSQNRLFAVPKPHCHNSDPAAVPTPDMTLVALLADAKHTDFRPERRPSVCASERSCSSSCPEIKAGSERLGVFVHSVHHSDFNPDVPVLVSLGTFLEFMGDALINASSWAESSSNDKELKEKYATGILGADQRGATSLALHVVGPCSEAYASLESTTSTACKAVCEALTEASNLKEVHLIAFTDDEAIELSKALSHCAIRM
eukprot:gnl/MRDRNA2_/MRDRNA2_90112_c0_seq1.p1 gnl/MRDRNA2_/MRDRNA2_90112_c0~~gnl/MRDRNA2_/MRDRNA2_90112_c0_seq1.p1  ORF type:complete len:316 (+),score=62.64 gnl/MRDRNA2_/MRDRNA2_90112_c0_seq1:83-1030(+)